eukprot:COSAG06_NODE_10264_length_1715_cov_1.834158_1_plen_49_part_00
MVFAIARIFHTKIPPTPTAYSVVYTATTNDNEAGRVQPGARAMPQQAR